jgi:hypothetical protein
LGFPSRPRFAGHPLRLRPRLGWSRDRIFEVVVTDPIKAVIVSANLKASVGDN